MVWNSGLISWSHDNNFISYERQDCILIEDLGVDWFELMLLILIILLLLCDLLLQSFVIGEYSQDEVGNGQSHLSEWI